MGTAETFVLGGIAGSTILLGLPIARIRQTRPEPRVALAAVATGILVFLLWDVLTNGVEPVTHALEAHNWGPFSMRAAILAVGFAIGLMGLVYYDWWMKARRASPLVGPGAAAVDEFRRRGIHALSPAHQLAVMIATGIGIHNFGEGLAIGQSAAAGKVSLALVLIIGFGLHNATEGFAVTGPLSYETILPSWRFLDRPLLGEPVARGLLLRPRRRLDPLRRDRARGGLPAGRDAGARGLDGAARDHARLRDRLRAHGRRRVAP